MKGFSLCRVFGVMVAGGCAILHGAELLDLDGNDSQWKQTRGPPESHGTCPDSEAGVWKDLGDRNEVGRRRLGEPSDGRFARGRLGIAV